MAYADAAVEARHEAAIGSEPADTFVGIGDVDVVAGDAAFDIVDCDRFREGELSGCRTRDPGLAAAHRGAGLEFIARSYWVDPPAEGEDEVTICLEDVDSVVATVGDVDTLGLEVRRNAFGV